MEYIICNKKESVDLIKTDDIVKVFESSDDLNLIKSLIEKAEDRIYLTWATVEAKDRDGELIPVDKDYIEKERVFVEERGGPIHDEHSNANVGRTLAFKVLQHPKTNTTGILHLNKIYNHNDRDNSVWKDIVSGKKKGSSVGGIADSTRSHNMTDEGFVQTINNFAHFETSAVETPCNPFALNEAFSLVAKSHNSKMETTEKEKIPLKPGEKPPKGAKVTTGPRGGKYYESGGQDSDSERQQDSQRAEAIGMDPASFEDLTPGQQEEIEDIVSVLDTKRAVTGVRVKNSNMDETENVFLIDTEEGDSYAFAISETGASIPLNAEEYKERTQNKPVEDMFMENDTYRQARAGGKSHEEAAVNALRQLMQNANKSKMVKENTKNTVDKAEPLKKEDMPEEEVPEVVETPEEEQSEEEVDKVSELEDIVESLVARIDKMEEAMAGKPEEVEESDEAEPVEEVTEEDESETEKSELEKKVKALEKENAELKKKFETKKVISTERPANAEVKKGLTALDVALGKAKYFKGEIVAK